MGKGLSDLQKFILQETYKKHQISNPEILIKRYGFKQMYSGGIKFNRNQIGMKRYLSVSAAVANSLTRLKKRGLMIRGGCPNWGHRLTKSGIQVVKKNRVKLCYNG